MEIGCGTGRVTKQLGENYHKVKGIDIEEKYIKYCRENIKNKNIFFETKDIQSFFDEDKYDVIIFSWIGLHYQENIEKIMSNIKNISKKDTLIIVLDAYYDSEYVKVLQQIRPVDLNGIKLLKEKLNEKLITYFNNFNQEILQTEYNFETIDDVINNFKIELTLEESYNWSQKDEMILREYLEKKSNPLVMGEALCITQCVNSQSTPNP